MEFLKELKELLLKIQRTYGNSRAEYITTISNKIADDTSIIDVILQADLAILASDLGFYESDERDRDIELGYYGDERLIEITNDALKMIDENIKTKP